MCGICGFITKKEISLNVLNKMNDLMTHRGPDDHGADIICFDEGFRLGLAQRRLSIMDISPLGHQPMHSYNNRLEIVFNGEIYNFLELKQQLADYSFKSDCDTEVILAAYLKWGMDFINHIDGMFAFALYDKENDSLILARDRVGKKPLYYYLKDDTLVFASELKPILACPAVTKELRTDIIGRYLTNKYINAPDSIIKNVYKLEPGCILCFNHISQNGTRDFYKTKYWDINERYHECRKNPVCDYNSAKEELKKLIEKAVSRRLNADVPVGIILSGGYDSTLVTAIAQKLSNYPVKTFTIGFEDRAFNEAPFAKVISDYLHTDHNELIITEKDLFEQLDKSEWYFDEPFADASEIPTMLVSKLARSKVTVALGGDGGDEFFCGYPMYEFARTLQKLDKIGALVHGFCNLPVIRKTGIEYKLPLSVQTVSRARDNSVKTQFKSVYSDYAKQMLHDEQVNCRHPIEGKYGIDDLMIRRMLVDMDTFLPGDILCKSDRASMKYSLELRSPLLDTSVIEYSFRIDHKMKYYKGDKKHILKDITHDYVPKELVNRPKQGFGVPLAKWLRGALREELQEYLNLKFVKEQGIFNYSYLNSFANNFLNKKVINNFSNRGQGSFNEQITSEMLWSYYLFQRWYNKVFKNAESIINMTLGGGYKYSRLKKNYVSVIMPREAAA